MTGDRDSPADELPEQVDGEGHDPGGMPFDDSFPIEEIDPGGRGDGVAYDSPKLMNERGIDPPASTPIGMKELRQYVMARWGGADLGILARPPRPVRGGTTPSLHNWGMAWDWRWEGPGPGRAAADEVIEFCLAHSPVLGVQAVHDYVQCRYWKSYAGWRDGTPSGTTGMGQPWAQWLHIERTWFAANLASSIEASLAGQTATASAPRGEHVALPDGPLRRGSSGADVARLQDFLRFFGYADFSRSDGVFGPRTEQAVKAAQTAFAASGWYSAAIDGIWGPKSNAAAQMMVSSLAPA
jgi:hypothetical protein